MLYWRMNGIVCSVMIVVYLCCLLMLIILNVIMMSMGMFRVILCFRFLFIVFLSMCDGVVIL